MKDLTGKKFNRLTAIQYMGKSRWLCKCECGKESVVSTHYLTTLRTQSCGCLKYRPVNQYTLDDKLITKYPSTIEAQKQTGIWQGNISSACMGRNKTAGGYKWEYAD